MKHIDIVPQSSDILTELFEIKAFMFELIRLVAPDNLSLVYHKAEKLKWVMWKKYIEQHPELGADAELLKEDLRLLIEKLNLDIIRRAGLKKIKKK